MAPEDLACERIEVGDLQTNCYLLYSRRTAACLIIDPGAEPEKIAAAVSRLKLEPAGIILTHGHFDHFGAIRPLQDQMHLPLWMYETEGKLLASELNRELGQMYGFPSPPAADHLLQDGDRIETAGIALTVMHTPGHTPGSMALLVDGWLFSGDTLFQGDIGRTDLPGGDAQAMQASLEKILALPDPTVVFPGHGDATTIAEEKRRNPYL